MPYFVFRIPAGKGPTLLDTFARFADAKNYCREQRRAQAPGGTDVIRMAFAAAEPEARRLLSDKREPTSPLEDWEA